MIDVPLDRPCPHCGRFANRGVSVDAIIMRDNKVLLIKRGIEPFKGYWATIGGYVEWNETAEETAKREVEEEVGLTITSTTLVGVYSSPKRHPKQAINIVYVATVAPSEPKTTEEATEIRWCPLNELPEEMAFDHKQNIADAQALKLI